MSDQVHLPDAAFEHSRLHLAPPNGLQGGAYFAMLYYKDSPLYIQTPKCTSRQAVVPGKRPYIDLMFSSNDVTFLEWLEALEADAVRLIYEKRNAWISADLEKSDIEAGFTSPVRPYKGGKHYLIRAHIQPAKTQSCSCSVFDENERPVSVDHIKAEHQMYTVLEFQGIKFTSRSFQLEVALKQVLLVSNVPIFQACVIRKPNAAPVTTDIVTTDLVSTTDLVNTPLDAALSTTALVNTPLDAALSTTALVNTPLSTTALVNTPLSTTALVNTPLSNTPLSDADVLQDVHAASSDNVNVTAASSDNVNVNVTATSSTNVNVNVNSSNDSNVLQEINLDVLEELEHMHLKLKKPTEVYYNMYRNAKQKAKDLKKGAIAAYLEAKQIKSAHMLEDSDSDDNSDNSDYSDNNSEFMQ
jgi:hypothetical protein